MCYAFPKWIIIIWKTVFFIFGSVKCCCFDAEDAYLSASLHWLEIILPLHQLNYADDAAPKNIPTFHLFSLHYQFPFEYPHTTIVTIHYYYDTLMNYCGHLLSAIYNISPSLDKIECHDKYLNHAILYINWSDFVVQNAKLINRKRIFNSKWNDCDPGTEAIVWQVIR